MVSKTINYQINQPNERTVEARTIGTAEAIRLAKVSSDRRFSNGRQPADLVPLNEFFPSDFIFAFVIGIESNISIIIKPMPRRDVTRHTKSVFPAEPRGRIFFLRALNPRRRVASLARALQLLSMMLLSIARANFHSASR